MSKFMVLWLVLFSVTTVRDAYLAAAGASLGYIDPVLLFYGHAADRARVDFLAQAAVRKASTAAAATRASSFSSSLTCRSIPVSMSLLLDESLSLDESSLLLSTSIGAGAVTQLFKGLELMKKFNN